MKIVEKPWGNYRVIERTDKYLIKIITIKPKERLSEQYHGYRNEHWFILQGYGIIELDYKSIYINPYDSYDIKRGEVHTAMNNSEKDDLVILETQTGDKLLEEDVIRIWDKYGRIKK